jgi:hypothetical protein
VSDNPVRVRSFPKLDLSKDVEPTAECPHSAWSDGLNGEASSCCQQYVKVSVCDEPRLSGRRMARNDACEQTHAGFAKVVGRVIFDSSIVCLPAVCFANSLIGAVLPTPHRGRRILNLSAA